MNDAGPGFVSPQLRREYTRGELHESDVLPDPIEQFRRWFEAATLAVAEPNAMILATADGHGRPSARVVLLKEFDTRGFVFFTNYCSRKCEELAANPRAALCFYWQAMERQIRIEGTVERVSREESGTYFHSRPLAAQVGAWVSRQSHVIVSRQELDQREADLLVEYQSKPVPLPDFWGGVRVVPEVVEFWQGRPSRLHDRIRYLREGNAWKIERLSP